MPNSRRPARTHDIVLAGASGFVGRLVAQHLALAAPARSRIALAGRSRGRLESVRAALPNRAKDWPLIEYDAHDPAATAALAATTRVVATTIGPYARLGLPLVRACADAGTHYADLTGEVLFVRETLEQVHDVAVRTGARIVHSCGFDSVPSDLSMLVLHETVGEFRDATLTLERAKGGVSGGTVDSLRGQVDAIRADRGLARTLLDPYTLSPAREREADLGRQPDLAPVHRADGRWLGPFVMASFNTRIVRRSNALLDFAYGHELRYREQMAFGSGPAGFAGAAGVAAGLQGAGVGLAFAPTRAILDRILPAPGDGPDESSRANGYFRTVTRAHGTQGHRAQATFGAHGDPGYAATAVMLGQCALALLGKDLPDRGGVLTPATGIGSALVARLRTQGFVIEVSVEP